MSEENNSKSEAKSKLNSSTPEGGYQKGTTFFNQSGQAVTNQTNVVGDYHDNRVITAGTFVDGVQNNQSLDPAVLDKLFADLNQRIEKMEAGFERDIAQKTVQGLKEEAEKGEKADESKVQKMFKSLLNVAPDAWEVAVATFLNPIAGVGMAFKKIAERAKAEQTQK